MYKVPNVLRYWASAYASKHELETLNDLCISLDLTDFKSDFLDLDTFMKEFAERFKLDDVDPNVYSSTSGRDTSSTKFIEEKLKECEKNGGDPSLFFIDITLKEGHSFMFFLSALDV
jgi:hypothetical protein